MSKSVKIMTGIVGFFMLIPGIAKFFEPFKTFFHVQIVNSEMPFPLLAKIMGQGGEILVGLFLTIILFFWEKFDSKLVPKVFVFSNVIVIGILLVSIYAHLHPAVPSEVLPAELKPPVLSIALIILAVFNIYGIRKNFVFQANKLNLFFYTITKRKLRK